MMHLKARRYHTADTVLEHGSDRILHPDRIASLGYPVPYPYPPPNHKVMGEVCWNSVHHP